MLQGHQAAGSQDLQDRCTRMSDANAALEAQLRDANTVVLELQVWICGFSMYVELQV